MFPDCGTGAVPLFRTPNNPYISQFLLIVKFLTRDNSVNIDATEIKFIPLDSSHREESNDIKFVKIRSVDLLKTGVCRIGKFSNVPLK